MSYYSQNASYRRAQAAYDAMEPPVGRYDHLDELDLEGLQSRLYFLSYADEYGEYDAEIALIQEMIAEQTPDEE